MSDPKKIDYHCKVCGDIRNDKLGYVKCLKCGLGVERSKNQP